MKYKNNLYFHDKNKTKANEERNEVPKLNYIIPKASHVPLNIYIKNVRYNTIHYISFFQTSSLIHVIMYIIIIEQKGSWDNWYVTASCYTSLGILSAVRWWLSRFLNWFTFWTETTKTYKIKNKCLNHNLLHNSHVYTQKVKKKLKLVTKKEYLLKGVSAASQTSQKPVSWELK